MFEWLTFFSAVQNERQPRNSATLKPDDPFTILNIGDAEKSAVFGLVFKDIIIQELIKKL